MAIQFDLQNSQYGIAFNGAYYRIVTAAVSRMREGVPKFTVMIDLSAYATTEPTDDTREVDFRRYHTDYEEIVAQTGDDFLSKCYTWVMTQDDMAGSTAV